MFEAFQQLMRYSDQREETKLSGLREGEPRLFYMNQLLIRTSGEQADIGTITSTDEEFFFPWRDIYPKKYRAFTPPLGRERPQETMIQGALPKETLLDLVRTCLDLYEYRQGAGEGGRSVSTVSGRLQDHRPAPHGPKPPTTAPASFGTRRVLANRSRWFS